MSKSSVASAPKLPTQLPQKSAWARGPPNSSSAPTPRSQSPAIASGSQPATATHSRRPSTLSQAAVSFKDGAVGARSPAVATKPSEYVRPAATAFVGWIWTTDVARGRYAEGAGTSQPAGAYRASGTSVTFGSIDDDSAPISSSPASVPPIKTQAPKSFGSVTAAPAPVSAVNGKPSTASSASVSSTAKPSGSASHPKFDVKKLFQGSSSSAPSQPSSEPVPSPSTRTTSLPQQPPPQASSSHAPPATPYGNHSFAPFVPAGGLRHQPNGAGGSGPPRSPSSYRQVPNGTAPPVNGRPSGPGAPGVPQTPMSTGMPSPRLGPPMAGQPAGMPPGQPMWNPYGYYQYPPPEWAYGQPWMQHMPAPQPAHAPGMQGPPHQPPHPHQQPGMPMSPRHPPTNLHTPSTPNLSPAVTAPISTPSPHMHTSSLSTVTSPPSTPASSTGPGLAGGIMDRNAKPFIPQRKVNVTIKSPSGQEINVEAFKRHGPSGSVSGFQSPISAVPGSPARKTIRMESEEAKRERLAEEQRKKDEAEKAEKAKKEEEEARIRKEKEAAERKQKEEEEARRKKEEEEKERLRKEEEERIRKEVEEKRRKDEEEQRRKDEEERRRKEEEEARLKKEAEEKEKLRKEEEEKERLRKEAEEKAKAEAAAAAAASVHTVDDAVQTEEPEEGELDEKDDSKSNDKPPLRLDTAVTGASEPKRRPGPLDLSGTKGPIAPPLPSALATARIIDDLGRIDYPEGIKSPKIELNVNAKQGKFRYDRDFLLQFMAVCKDKPDNLPPLDAIGLEPSDQNFPMTRTGSGPGRRPSSSNMGPPSNPRSASVGLGISGFGNKPGSGGFNMGQFATAGSKMSSEERFALSNRSASVSGGPAGMPFGRPSPMVRTSSQGGPGGVPMGSNRTRSQRGGKRGDKNNAAGPSQSSVFGSNAQMMTPLEPVAPLEVSANRWTPMSKKGAAPADEDAPEVVERKVKSLLNKLTMERFDSISDQIITWANRSEQEKDGRTLIQVIRLVFEKATDEAAWSEMYARLCRKMMEQISPKVQDDGIKTADGRPITGGHLFRKYLLNRCQEDFERGWASKESTAAAAASKAGEDQAAAKAAAGTADETALYSDEYYAAQKAKRQGLGLIKFIGELFKLQMLTERIMHECVKKLLGNVENPEEEEIESLCQLLTTVGALLDTPKARAHMDVYFSRMKELTRTGNVNSRMQFMLQDVIELRERKWIPRNQQIVPSTIAAVHEAAAKEKASQEKEQYQRTLSMSRGGSRRGAERGEHQQVGPDGWAVAGGAAQRPPSKAGDLSQFGKITKNTSMTFGPSSVFAAAKSEKKRESTISRTGSMNMFSMLSQNPELANEVQTNKGSRPPSRKPSIDLGQGGAPEAPMQRRKLNLLPRSVPKDDEKGMDSPAPSTAVSDDEGAESNAPSMSEDTAKARIEEDCKELFNVRDLGEAEVYFTKLPTEYRHKLVDKLVTTAIDAKEADVALVADLFARAAEKGWCPADAFEEGFVPTAEFLDDIVIDVPKAVTQFANMLKAAGLDDERKKRIAEKSPESGAKLLGLLDL
ncbi:hypothetical protein EIP86_003841 [Pleurotus ostreatoroseus]|nr:hypothetical protein EIP86_003841 [Pleurotus ostreatoroseus]